MSIGRCAEMNGKTDDTSKSRKMEEAEVRYFKNQLRAARAIALKDAEAFGEIVFTVEQLGKFLCGVGYNKSGLGAYCEKFVNFIKKSQAELENEFRTLYKLVKEGRNDAFHNGTRARHLTANAISLSIMIEDALMNNASDNASCRYKAKNIMVPNPLCAYVWQTVDMVRRDMLANAFTYLPFAEVKNDKRTWRLISDYMLAHYLSSDEEKRKAKLAKKLGDIIDIEDNKPPKAKTCSQDEPMSEINDFTDGRPVLVLGPEPDCDLLGIITAADVL